MWKDVYVKQNLCPCVVSKTAFPEKHLNFNNQPDFAKFASLKMTAKYTRNILEIY